MNKTLIRWSKLVVIRKRDSRRKLSRRATISTGRRRTSNYTVFSGNTTENFFLASLHYCVAVVQPFFFGRLRFPNISIITWHTPLQNGLLRKNANASQIKFISLIRPKSLRIYASAVLAFAMHMAVCFFISALSPFSFRSHIPRLTPVLLHLLHIRAGYTIRE